MWKFLRKHSLVHAVCISWIITLAAQVKIPLHPVPVAMGDFAIMLIALVCTPNVAVGSVLLFLGYGVLGLPVLSSGATGLSMFLGPTAGYLAGFVLGAGRVSFWINQYPTRCLWKRMRVLLFGYTLLFFCGIFRLAQIVGLEKAIQMGFYPFVWISLLKLFLVAHLSLLLTKPR